MSLARALRPARTALFVILASSGATLGSATSAAAQTPWWHLESRAAPTNLAPGGEGQLIVSASNVGDAQASASAEQPITITDKLPARLTATAISAKSSFPEELPMSCSLQQLSCSYTSSQGVLPYKRLEVVITVKVAPGPSGQETNSVNVQGGGSPPQPPLTSPVQISSQPIPFGVERYELTPEQEGGAPDTQAGSHPLQLTTTFDLNQTLEPNKSGKTLVPHVPALLKDLAFHLPPGLLGNPTATPRCSDVDFSTLTENGFTNLCQPNTTVGVAVVTIDEPEIFPFATVAVPIFNLTPAPGEPARFGFAAFKVPVVLDTAVKSSEGYGVVVSVKDATQAAAILGSQVTFWGDPGAESHDSSRGWACLGLPDPEARKNCQPPSEHPTSAFLTLPSSCTGQPLQSTVHGDSWPTAAAPAGLELPQASTLIEPLGGCQALPFTPTITAEPDQHTTSTPSGMTVDVQVPQQGTLTYGDLGESAVKNTTVALPQGVQLSPAAAGGLFACSGLQAGLLSGSDERLQTGNETFSEALSACPEEAKVATVKIKTPLLDHEPEGDAYLASQNTNPFASPLVLYLLVHDPVSGVLVKLAGTVTLDPATGQLVSTFANTPQLPFEELKLHFFDGPRASLSTPASCGSYETRASFAPWSGSAPAGASSNFQISAGAEGSGCADPQPLAPAFNAQSQNTQAGAFTSFTVNLRHRDQDQPLSGLSVRLPSGIAAMLASVSRCGETQVADGSCGPQSLIGHTSTSSGLGGEPFTLSGQVYLTGPYNGAPFGLSIVTPAVAGPFNLGVVIVRAGIYVDPATAAVTIDSAVPTMVETASAGRTGVPVALKQLSVTIDRPGFEFNPTNCSPMRIDATITGSQGASTPVSSPFQVAGCSGLPFKPKLTASTKGQASKANGANFDVKVESKGLGQANIAKVRLQLPKALPARLTTLQKACTEGAFNANPASCPGGSVIGQATIHTPVLSNPLTGPAYLVSHGGAAFPDVEFVLQGEGITLVLDGKTQIKNQITYSKFESAPDAPFTVFETVLPAGPHSALTTNVPEKDKFNLCSSRLSMPTEIVGQNGAVLKRTTKIALQGCKKVTASRPLSRTQLLKRALAGCRKQHMHSKARRQACERQSRKRYAVENAAHRAHKGRAHHS
jgi:hypothetical protein